MSHELISVIGTPTLPSPGSSWIRGNYSRGRILASQDHYAFFEYRPLTVRQMNKHFLNQSVPHDPLQFLYTLVVYYRKSRNPHGPSARPIFAFCLEYSVISCAMKPQGFWAKLTGTEKEPAEVFYTVFCGRLRENHGTVQNHFTDESAKQYLLEEACESLMLPHGSFRELGPLSLGTDSPEIASEIA